MMRRLLARMPKRVRFAMLRAMVDCDPDPDLRLELKVAETREELEDCFRILHDAYVASGFMKPDPSGMRVTIYHALPTTTTLCAKWEGRVVGTISMIREGVFGFPLQSVFDLEQVRRQHGQIAEISALAVHPEFRKTGGAVLFPLMKFMREYCVKMFDTRHLVIAVNPDRIDLYEALLFFERLRDAPVAEYDFANGAPAVGATLDLQSAGAVFRRGYRGRPPRRNLHSYLFELALPNIKMPQRRYFTTNDPVMTPELLDYFFNQRTQVFDKLDNRRKALLWSIYDIPEYRRVLPLVDEGAALGHPLRRHQRYSLRAPAELKLEIDGAERIFVFDVVEISLSGFQAESRLELPLHAHGEARVQLGRQDWSRNEVSVVRCKKSDNSRFYGFRVAEPDDAWCRCVAALEVSFTSHDLVQ
ncbi:GNAT family N-acetyltransferase [Roseateles saccharophilus]|uniref:PilZ domain-containing protein n=2 Tax=Roseateles saccharophilus TaxID=304 RepID=A0A4R3UI61_ROSSA|nr:GNAT family N-acetyltransferase [Roseateles saccharophilus]TCU88333.1 PilZ domain-containing protein [Roseateles saccharophilus]